MWTKTFLLVFLLAAAFGAAPLTAAAENIEEGLAAYDAGDYTKALELFWPLAEQGSARAQSKLGVMYLNGWGVTRDDAEAVRWFRKGAEQGEALAQNNLGAMYENGRGLTRDDPEAVRW